MTSDAIAHQKAALRERQLSYRNKCSAQEREEAGIAVAREFVQLVPIKPGVIVSGFFPVGHEFDCMPLLHAAQEAGAALALPRIMPKRILMFLPWRPGDAMSEGPLGIPYPASGEEVHPDIVITPLLAFDEQGRRLGYGGGYYDRAIARLRAMKPIISIGVAQAWQKADDLPAEEHDEDARLDFILTENGAIHCRTSH